MLDCSSSVLHKACHAHTSMIFAFVQILGNIKTMDPLHLQSLRDLKHLEVLKLDDSIVDKDVCAMIAQATTLRILSLQRAVDRAFTSTAFARLGALTGLQDLDVTGNRTLKAEAIDHAAHKLLEDAKTDARARIEIAVEVVPRCGVLKHLVPLTHLQRASFHMCPVAPIAARAVEVAAGMRPFTIQASNRLSASMQF